MHHVGERGLGAAHVHREDVPEDERVQRVQRHHYGHRSHPAATAGRHSDANREEQQQRAR